MRQLSLNSCRRLVEALLAIDEIANGPSRRQIMSYMNPQLRAAVPDLDSARAHVVAWLRMCDAVEGGRGELVDVLLLCVADTIARRRFLALVDEVWPHEAP